MHAMSMQIKLNYRYDSSGRKSMQSPFVNNIGILLYFYFFHSSILNEKKIGEKNNENYLIKGFLLL